METEQGLSKSKIMALCRRTEVMYSIAQKLMGKTKSNRFGGKKKKGLAVRVADHSTPSYTHFLKDESNETE